MKFNALVLPNDKLSIYVKQGNLDQFLGRFEYYAKHLGTVFIYNADDVDVTCANRNVHIINARASKNFAVDFFNKIRALRTICKRERIDFLRTTEGGNFIKSAIVGIVGKLCHKPVVVSIHGTWRGLSTTRGKGPYKLYHKLLFSIMEFITRYTMSITFVIDKMYIDELGWPSIHIVPNSVDTNRFSPTGAQKRWAGVYVGALHKRKGIAYLVEAARQVRKQERNARFAVIGHGEHEKLAKHEPAVEYIGAVPNRNLPKYYNQAKVFVTAALHEGFAIPVIEAQACGLPIVATDLPPFHNNTIPGKSSVLVPLRNPKALADAVLALLHNEKRRLEMGRAGRKFVRKHFGEENVLGKEVELIKLAVLGGLRRK